ncbi:amino acid adenylation domain-containing protein [Nocardiopsis alba]|uniref:amino acid adenylation domain-containing protein n=1 Tax=Nocardiopsis alba TaxID=53437 RepID=UPI003408D7CF
MSEADIEPAAEDLPQVAIVGMACRFPGADSVTAFWDLLRQGRDPSEEVTLEELRAAGREHLATTPGYVNRRKTFADVSMFDAEHFGMTPAEARATDPQQRFLLETSVQALEHAALSPGTFEGDIGVSIGLNHSDYLLEHVLGDERVHTQLGRHRVLMGNDRGFTATQIAYRLGLTGPSTAVDSACSSSLAAVHGACQALLAFEADAMVAGGAAIKPMDLGYVHAEGGIGSPDGVCRPFSDEAAGTVFSSGVGLVVLRRLEDALADGDRILAVIRAGAVNNDGSRKSGYAAPSVDGQAELISRVHELGGVRADQIGYVEAHGTATALGDSVEVAALTQAFRASAEGVGFCEIGSVKSNIGHLDSASGVAGLIKTVLCLWHRELVPSLWCERVNPHLHLEDSPFRVSSEHRPWSGVASRLAGVSSFGVGGTNVHLLLEEAPPPETSAEPGPGAGRSVPVHFSARTMPGLRELGERLASEVSRRPDEAPDFEYTLRRGTVDRPYRGALLRRVGGEVLRLEPSAATVVPDGSAPEYALLLDTVREPGPLLKRLAEERPNIRRRLDDAHAAVGEPTRAEYLDVLLLACAEEWTMGARAAPAAVVAHPDARNAAAVLCGVLREEDLAGVWRSLRLERSPMEALDGGPLRSAAVPWYDKDGSEVCRAGRPPAASSLVTGLAENPGRRGLPPLLDAVVDLVPAPGRPAWSTASLGSAPLLRCPEECEPGDEALSAISALGWSVGLWRPALPHEGRIVDLPPHPFRRDRYWLERTGSTSASGTEATVVRSEDSERTPDEVGALEIFAEVLGVEVTELHADSDLFSIGGDSLTAQMVVAAARRRWDARIPFGSFVAEPTPARLVESAVVRRPSTEKGPAGAETPGTELPLTPAQERFLFLQELDGGAESYNVPVLADLHGHLDTAAFHAALIDVVDRHVNLRSVFVDGPDGPVQRILEPPAFDMPVVDVPDETTLREEVSALLAERIPLDRAPTLKARLYRTAPDRHVLAVSVHHICADARSTGLFLRDLYALYESRIRNRPSGLPMIEGAVAGDRLARGSWSDSEEAAAQLRFWNRYLDGSPGPIELPGDRPPTNERSFRGGKVDFTVEVSITDRVRALAVRTGTSSFPVIFAAFQLFLSRIAQCEEPVTGVPVSGRQGHEVQDLVGDFVNTLPLRTRVDPEGNFLSLVEECARDLTSALDHQDVPVESIVRGGDAGGGPGATAFNVLFNLLSASSSVPKAPEGLIVRPLGFDRSTSPFELSLDCWFTGDDRLAGRFLYDADRFDTETISYWSELFTFFLETVTADPDMPVRDLSPLPGDRIVESEAALSGPVVEGPDRTVQELFLERVEATPDALAVTDDAHTLTYDRLARAGAGVALRLLDEGVSPGDHVAIAMARSAALVTAVLGVLRAGAVPVPLDLSHPRARLNAIIEDCGAEVLLGAEPAAMGLARDVRSVEMTGPEEFIGPAGRLPGDAVEPSESVYLTYTSGTTGRPKGIRFPQAALTNLVRWETEGFDRSHRWLQLASFGFDAAFHEAFSALCSGGSLHVVDEEAKHDHDLLADFIERHGVTKAILPVSLLQALAARFRRDPAPFRSLKEIASTGEQLRLSEPLIAFFEGLPDCRLINNYGPAETHVVTSYRFSGPPSEWPWHAPIGKPIDNVEVRLRGREGGPVPRGSVGELDIAGVCVATGYLDRPELNRERFVEEPVRAYRSGDRARLLPSGDIVFLGRGDQQVKIRGFRVEPVEIEIAVRKVSGVRDVALVIRGEEGDRHIDAYLVSASEERDLASRVRRHLVDRLPAPMIPRSFTVLERLPVNANGKVEHDLLPRPEAFDEAGSDEASPRGVVSRVLEVFRSVLERADLDVHADFFEAGGHSLSATRLLHRLREEHGVPLRMAEFYRLGTPASVARAIEQRIGSSPALEEELPVEGPPKTVPLGVPGVSRGPGAPGDKTFVFECEGPIDVERLENAVNAVVARHPALRLRFGPAGEVDVEPTSERYRVLVRPVRGERSEHGRSRGIAQALHEEWRSVPLSSEAPALRVVYVGDPGTSGGHLIVTLAVSALDGEGTLTLLRDLGAAYASPGALGGEDDGYLRYLSWRSLTYDGERREETLEVWRNLLVRAPRPWFEFGPRWAEVEPELVWAPAPALLDTVRQWCIRSRSTSFRLHLTAFSVALALVDGSASVCPVTAMDGRVHPSLNGSVGAFANLLPVPSEVRDEHTLARVLEGVDGVLERVEDVRAVPFADLAVADPALATCIDRPVVFGYQREDTRELALGRTPLRPVGPDVLGEDQRMRLTVTERADSLRVGLLRRAGDRSGGEELMDTYQRVLYALVFEPERTVRTLRPRTLPPTVRT